MIPLLKWGVKMIFEEKKVILKDGTSAVLKTPETKDAKTLLDNVKFTAVETDFFSRSIEDWDGFSVEDEAKWISNVRESNNDLVITCFINGEAVGNCDITFKNGVKTIHRATVGIAIQKKYWNIGIGSAMFEELIKAAKAHEGTEIVDLEFVEGNNRAKALYEKFGFKVVSVKPNFFKMKNGTYQNLVYMQKYL